MSKLYHSIMMIRETYQLGGTQMEDEISNELQTLLDVFRELKSPNPSPYKNEEVVYLSKIEDLFAKAQRANRRLLN